MGTSTPFGGGKNGNPLLPSWLDDATPPVPLPPNMPPFDAPPPAGPPNKGPNGQNDPNAPPNGAPVPPPPNGADFRRARTNFTRYAKSGGEDRRALGRAVGSYVRSAAGGSGTASRRMASERAALGALSRIFGGAHSAPGGIQEFVRTLNLGHLAGRTVQEVYVALVDYIFPPNGDMDDAYARDAYLEAVAEFDCSHIEHPDATTSREFIAAFLAHAIHIRTINAIANGIIVMPSDVELANAISAGLMGFIRGGVTDAIAGIDVLQTDQFQSQIDDLCERAVSFIEGDADAAAEERQ